MTTSIEFRGPDSHIDFQEWTGPVPREGELVDMWVDDVHVVGRVRDVKHRLECSTKPVKSKKGFLPAQVELKVTVMVR